MLGRLGFVEHVVDDLEHQADRGAEAVEAFEGFCVGLGGEATASAGRPDQGPGLQPVDQAKSVLLLPDLVGKDALGVVGLSVDHQPRPDEDFAEDRQGIARAFRGDLHCDALQGVAGEDRDAFVERPVDRRSAASEIVVVEGGQVVMDEAEGMDALERDRGGNRIFDLATGGEAGTQGEDRAEALAAAEDRVAGGLVDRGGELPGGDRAFERGVDPFDQVVLHGVGSVRGGEWSGSGHGESITVHAADSRSESRSPYHPEMDSIDSILDFMARGGLVMWPLLFLSILTVSVVLERAVFWGRLDSRRGRGRYRALAEALRRGDVPKVTGLVTGDGSPYSDLARDVVEHEEGVDEATVAVLSEEVRPRFERGLLLLSTIVTAAPMLGILGTVIGIIRSFELLGGDATITDPNQVSGGIAEALFTTAAGLVVALVALFPYMLFRGRQERALGRLESLATAAITGLAADRRKTP